MNSDVYEIGKFHKLLFVFLCFVTHFCLFYHDINKNMNKSLHCCCGCFYNDTRYVHTIEKQKYKRIPIIVDNVNIFIALKTA